MSFLHPEFLYLMLPPVLILFYFILTQKEPVALLFETMAFKRLRVNEKRLSFRQRNAIFLAVLILLILAMAQPVIVEARLKVKTPAPVIIAALDISASMQTRDLYPSRLAAAKAKLLQLIDMADAQRFGVLAFGKDVYVLSPPTSDNRALRQMLYGFVPEKYAEAGTNIGALLAAVAATQPDGVKYLLLLSDGGEVKQIKPLIAFAHAHDIRLFILATATPQGGAILDAGQKLLRNGEPVISRLNPQLHTLAERTGGTFMLAGTGMEDIASLLAAILADAKTSADGQKTIERYGQLFIFPLALALVLLLIAISSFSQREQVQVPSAFILGTLLLGGGNVLYAERYEFEVLGDAKEAYARGAYARAADDFYRYAQGNSDDPRALYDSANALYRFGSYAAAAALWKRVRTKDRLLQYAALHNLGNAYAMQGGMANFEAAIKAYQRALRLQNDRQTRENLEAVRGKLARLVRPQLHGGTNLPGASGTPSSALAMKQQDANASASAPEVKHAEKAAKDRRVEISTRMSAFETAAWVRMLGHEATLHLYKITPSRSPSGADSAVPW